MEENSIVDYSLHYSVGMRVGIDIPLSSGQIFREWGIIIEMDNDYIQLRLSRDILPEEMQIEVGTIFLLVTGKEGSGLCCRAIVVGETSRRVVPLRLISEALLYERRNFFRIAAYLPMAWQSCTLMSGRETREKWEEARLFRLWFWSEMNEALPIMKPLSQEQILRFRDMRESFKVSFQPFPANISGNGIRLKIPQLFKKDDKVAMQFFIPFAKPNIIDVVGEVVWTAPVMSSSSLDQHYYTAMVFYFIDERDRESILRFISLEELQQIQQLNGKENRPLLEDEPVSEQKISAMRLKRIAVAVVFIAIISVIAAWLLPGLISYISGNSARNPIGKSFESGINQYRKGKSTEGF